MTDTTAPLDLDAIEARAKAATEGPWTRAGRYVEGAMPPNPDDRFDVMAENVCRVELDYADAEFIAHAREDVPALVAAVRERDGMLAKISAAVAAGTYSNRELREAIQYIANVLDGAKQREPRATCFCGGEHITGTCLAGAEET